MELPSVFTATLIGNDTEIRITRIFTARIERSPAKKFSASSGSQDQNATEIRITRNFTARIERSSSKQSSASSGRQNQIDANRSAVEQETGFEFTWNDETKVRTITKDL